MFVSQEEFDDIRIHKLKMDRQNNGQKKKDKQTNNDQKNITLKIE